MSKSKNLCEEIEIAILSDEKLTDEQLNHIENCESCKALLSQAEKMKNELEGFSIPGLYEGQITQAVMEKVRGEKRSAPIPSFKLSHHLGTAAAIAIILSAALILKNPSDNIPDKAVVDNNSHSIEETVGTSEKTEPQHYIHAPQSNNETVATEDTEEATADTESSVLLEEEVATDGSREMQGASAEDASPQILRSVDSAVNSAMQESGAKESGTPAYTEESNTPVDTTESESADEDASFDTYGFAFYDGYGEDATDYFPDFEENTYDHNLIPVEKNETEDTDSVLQSSSTPESEPTDSFEVDLSELVPSEPQADACEPEPEAAAEPEVAAEPEAEPEPEADGFCEYPVTEEFNYAQDSGPAMGFAPVGGGSSGGGSSGGGSMAGLSPESDSVDMSDILNSIGFGDNLEENIALANIIMLKFTGTADFFNAADYSSNEDFLMTFENILIELIIMYG